MEWDEASQFPSELIPKLAEMGLLGVIFPEEYGGAGLGYIEYAIVDRGTCRAWMARSGLIVAAHNSLCTNHIYKFGNDGAAQEICHAAGAGQEARLLVADRAGSGFRRGRHADHRGAQGRRLVLNGAKTFTTNGHYADVCVAMAVTDQAEGRARNFRVHRGEGQRRDFAPGKKENKLGMRASDTSEVVFSDCLVPAENLLGKEGQGFVNSLQVLDGGRISIAALALGMAQGAYEAAAEIREAAQAIRQSHQRVSGHSIQAGRHGHGN